MNASDTRILFRFHREYIEFSNSVLNEEWYRDAEFFCLVSLVALASSFEDRQFGDCILKAGEFATSPSRAAMKLGWEQSAIIPVLRRAIEFGLIRERQIGEFIVLKIADHLWEWGDGRGGPS